MTCHKKGAEIMSQENQTKKKAKAPKRKIGPLYLHRLSTDYFNHPGQYQQSFQEIVKNLEAIANSKCIKQPAHIEASLWNAIEILEDLIAKEDGE